MMATIPEVTGSISDISDGTLTVTPSLGGEDRGHHATSDTTSSEFGSDHGGKGVITANAHSHDKSPTIPVSVIQLNIDCGLHDYDTVDRDTGRLTRDSLTEGSNNDDHLEGMSRTSLFRVNALTSSMPYILFLPT